MKFESLEIREIRGVRQFGRDLKESNLVVCGENGTGKSGVVDAVDFLLTGEMRRLKGGGSKDLHLDEHGKHILANLEDAYVEASLKVNSTSSIKVKRSIKTKKLEIESDGAIDKAILIDNLKDCLLYTSPSPRDQRGSRMPSSA